MVIMLIIYFNILVLHCIYIKKNKKKMNNTNKKISKLHNK